MPPTPFHTASPAPRARSGANSPGQELRALVVWAVAARRRSFTHGWSKLDHTLATHHCNLLSQWLRTHFAGGADMVRAFDRDLGISLRLVMPGNAAGKAKLKEYERILLTL